MVDPYGDQHDAAYDRASQRGRPRDAFDHTASMSWKALYSATGIRVGSPTMRLILRLLANKADEKFSCYLARRLAELPVPPSPSLRRKTPWCGECEDEQSRTITVTLPDGTEAAAFCPRCSPQKRPLSVDQKTANIEER